MPPPLFKPCVINSPFDGTLYNANMVEAENSFADLGPYVITGVTVTIGTGLSVNVASGTVSIGGRVTVASTTIAGLTDNTTNHLYILNTGGGTSNTTGTAPANSVKIGTAVTAGGVVTSVSMGRTSGRQQFVQPQNLVLGGPAAGTASAGHPRAANLASWNATQAEGFELFGTLPAGAVPAGSFVGLSDVSFTGVARGDIVYRGASAWNNRAAGTSGQFLKTNGAGADPTWATVDLTTLVTLAPASVDRNLIQSTANTNHALVTKNFSATLTGANPYEHRLSDGTVVFSITPAGRVFSGPDFSGTQPATNAFTKTVADFNPTVLITSPGGDGDTILAVYSGTDVVYLVNEDGGNQMMYVKSLGNSSRVLGLSRFSNSATADILQAQDENNNPLSGIKADGGIYLAGDLQFRRNSSTTANRMAADETITWVDNTDATRKARAVFNVWDTAAREALRLEASGTAAMIGFLGAAAVARAAAYTLSGSVTRTFPTDPSGAFTGIATGVGGTPYAQLTDLNTLRTAVSTLIGVVRQMATDLGSTSGMGLLNA